MLMRIKADLIYTHTTSSVQMNDIRNKTARIREFFPVPSSFSFCSKYRNDFSYVIVKILCNILLFRVLQKTRNFNVLYLNGTFRLLRLVNSI